MKLILIILCISCLSLLGSPAFILVEHDAQISGNSGRKSVDAERQQKIREELKATEIEWKNKDLSGYSTDELVHMELTFLPSPASVPVSEELAKRPQEVRVALEKELDKPLIPFDILYRIPFVAGKAGTEFQVEIAKRCLFRPEMKEVDLALRIKEEMGEGIFSLISRSRKDETAVLDRLISEGRLEKDSEFDLRWRARMSNRGETRPAKHLDLPRSEQSQAEISKESKNGSSAREKENSSPILWGMGAISVAGFIGLLWWLFKKA